MNNNIKYSNKEIKQNVENFFKSGVFYKNLLEKIIKKFSILKPVISDLEVGYDAIIFEITDKNSFIYSIKFDIFSDLITIMRNDKNFYKTYRIDDSNFLLEKKGYFKKDKIFEKVFRYDNILEYNFSNGFLNCKINIVLNNNQILDENKLIKELLEAEDEIYDISSLYSKISDLMGFEKISIVNKNQNYEEKIVVIFDILTEYKRRIVKGKEVEYLDYHDGKIFVTREAKENLELEKMKKIVK